MSGTISTGNNDVWREGEVLSSVLFQEVADGTGPQAVGHLSLTVLPMDSAEPITGYIGDGAVFEAAQSRDLAGEIVVFSCRGGRIALADFPSDDELGDIEAHSGLAARAAVRVRSIDAEILKLKVDLPEFVKVFAALSPSDLLKAARIFREQGDDDAAEKMEALSLERQRLHRLSEDSANTLNNGSG